MKSKIVLAYSGGLDTSVILKWLQTEYNADVIAYAADLGQGSELDEAKAKAKKLGARSPFLRPKRLSYDYVDINEVLYFTINKLEDKKKNCCCYWMLWIYRKSFD